VVNWGGTSFAAPHVAGIIAAYLSRGGKWDLPPGEMKKKLIEIGTKDVIDLGKIPDPDHNTPNVLVYLEPPQLSH
jgi:subtilisin family serine protease